MSPSLLIIELIIEASVGEKEDTNLLKKLALPVVSHSFHQICSKLHDPDPRRKDSASYYKLETA